MDWMYRISSYIGFAAIGILIAEAVAFGADWLRSRRRGLPSIALLADSLSDLRLRVSILETLATLRQDRQDGGAQKIDAGEGQAEQQSVREP
jgi:hypothetical protein